MFYPGSLTEEDAEMDRKHRCAARRAAADGMVLLENNGILPLSEGSRVALYGGGALYPVKGGTGSGDVNSRNTVNIADGFRNAGFIIADEEWLASYAGLYKKAYEEWVKYIYKLAGPGKDSNALYQAHAANPMPFPEGDRLCEEDVPKEDRENTPAVFVISRVSGEGADRKCVQGDFLLSKTEEESLKTLRKIYRRLIVILNVAGIIDLSVLDEIHPDALVLMSLAGSESGNALADVLSGKVNFSGHLTDTWGYHYEDYPAFLSAKHDLPGRTVYSEDIYVGYRYFDSFGVTVRYPFGYGLSYTDFSIQPEKTVLEEDGTVTVTARIKNIGKKAGREVVFLFVSCPEGLRKKEVKKLAAFVKTKELAPGEESSLPLSFSLEQAASFHTGKASWFFDAGEYYLLLGKNAADVTAAGVLSLSDTVFLKKEPHICPLEDALPMLKQEGTEKVRLRFHEEVKEKGLAPISMDKACEKLKEKEKAADSADGSPNAQIDEQTKEAEEILEKMTREQKVRLVCGRVAGSQAEFIGSASVTVPGAAGETSAASAKLGIMPLIMADGPAGLRLQYCYESDRASGEIIRLPRYEMLENRFFHTFKEHADAEKHYQSCTAFPVGMSLAQSFDEELVSSIGRAVGEEMDAFHVSFWLSPGMNIHRDPLCGRNFEYYSEDPLVTGKIAAAMTRGVQENPHRAVTIKHFACNSQEDDRMNVSAVVSERALREIYLRGFEIAVKESAPKAIMTSYNKINGVHSANNPDLIEVTARKDWGFQGIVMTDWTTTNAGHGASAAKCIASGNDIVMPGTPSDLEEINRALDSEDDYSLPEEKLNACCLRLIKMFRSLA